MYCLYYPDEGRYSVPMSYVEAKRLQKSVYEAYIVNVRTAEVVG
jgi:hypothetical protein